MSSPNEVFVWGIHGGGRNTPVEVRGPSQVTWTPDRGHPFHPARTLGIEQIQILGAGHGFVATVHIQFAIDVFEVGAHGMVADE